MVFPTTTRLMLQGSDKDEICVRDIASLIKEYLQDLSGDQSSSSQFPGAYMLQDCLLHVAENPFFTITSSRYHAITLSHPISTSLATSISQKIRIMSKPTPLPL